MAMSKVAYVFPGQGAQTVGMGLDLHNRYPTAREVFDEADSALGFPISRLCFEGPMETLTKTNITQPAILVTSIACLRAAQESGDDLPLASFAGGPSLGEYIALAAAGVLSVGDAARLAGERGRLMDEAGRSRPGGMLAVVGLDKEIIDDVCTRSGTVIANINAPGQIVISGTLDAIERAYKLAEEKNAYRIIPLKVGGAFHSPLMEPIIDEFSEVISSLAFHPPLFPIIGMAARRALTDVDEIKEDILAQILCCNDWVSCVEYMTDNNVDSYIEFGPGQAISRLINRINPQAQTFNISGVEDIARMQSWTGI